MTCTARATSAPTSSRYGKSHPMTRMPAAWAAGSTASRKSKFWAPSTDEPVRTYRCVSPTDCARAMIDGVSPSSAYCHCQIHMPLPDGTTGAGGGGGGGTVVGGTVVVTGTVVVDAGVVVVDAGAVVD